MGAIRRHCICRRIRRDQNPPVWGANSKGRNFIQTTPEVVGKKKYTLSKRIFSGLISPWINPFLWQCETASRICAKNQAVRNDQSSLHCLDLRHRTKTCVLSQIWLDSSSGIPSNLRLAHTRLQCRGTAAPSTPV